LSIMSVILEKETSTPEVEMQPREETKDGTDKIFKPKTYRHPLGEIHLRIIAWACMVISQIGCVMGFAGLIRVVIGRDSLTSSGGMPPIIEAGEVISALQYLYMPLVVIANFSRIIRSRDYYFKSLLQYGGYTLGLFVVYIYVYFHYIVRNIRKVVPDLSIACYFADNFFAELFSFLRSLNMFVDLLICTLIVFFTLYTPKKVFTGKLIYLFRSFVVIPIIWNILGYVFLGLNDPEQEGGAIIPGYLFPLIPLKPPVFLFSFICLVLYLKTTQRGFYKNGGTEEEYQKKFFEPESIHQFSRFTAIILAISSIVDLTLYLSFYEDHQTLNRIGIGQGMFMFLAIPVIWFFDFTKEIKNPAVGFLIPIISIAVIVLIWLETINWSAGKIIDLIMGLVRALHGSSE